jgi:hypothetical protein
MSIRIWIKIICTSLVVLTLAGLFGYLSLSKLKHNAQLIVEDTLPGLSYAGEANAYLADAARTLLVVVTEDPEQQRTTRDEITMLSARTTTYLEQYGSQLDSTEDRTNYDTLIKERKAYFEIRERVLALALAEKKSEALTLYTQEMIPEHKRVKSAGDKLFEYNRHQGEVRGRNILASCTVTQITVAILSVVIFVAGFFIGLFK